MPTPPDFIIRQLEIHKNRTNRRQILAAAAAEGLTEFFDGLRMCLDCFYTFDLAAVPVKEQDEGQGLAWSQFLDLADLLYRRQLRGDQANDAVLAALAMSTKSQWNDWYRRILLKNLNCGVRAETVNAVLKKFPSIAPVPVFACMQAKDAADHESKIQGIQLVEPELEGVRCVTVVNYEKRSVDCYNSLGLGLDGLDHIREYLSRFMEEFGRSLVFDGVRVNSDSDGQAARLILFDCVPLWEFKQAKSVMRAKQRREFLKNWQNIFADSGVIEIIEQRTLNLDTLTDSLDFQDSCRDLAKDCKQGLVIKDPQSYYVCEPSTAWLKRRAYVDVTVTVRAVSASSGSDRSITVHCGGSYRAQALETTVVVHSHEDRDDPAIDPDSLIGQILVVRADSVDLNSKSVLGLTRPRFIKFLGAVHSDFS